MSEMNFKPTKRQAERTAYCRSCDKEMPKGTEMVSWYSSANRGMHIHICMDCVKKIGELAIEKAPEIPAVAAEEKVGMEIERRFLVTNVEFMRQFLSDRPYKEIRQAYLNTDPYRTIRVRTEDQDASLCIKGKAKGAAKKELEVTITPLFAADVLPLTYGYVIHKRRYPVEIGGKTWEIDVFCDENEGLIIAEIELNTEDEELQIPGWCTKEITTEFQYSNANLSQMPFKYWPD